MKLNVELIALLETPYEVPALLQIEVPDIDGLQTVERAVLTIEPETDAQGFRDLYGNVCRRMILPAGETRVSYNASIVVPERRGHKLRAIDTNVMEIPSDVLHYLNPSRYCQSERLEQFAMAEFGGAEPGFDRVHAICAWIHEHVRYQYGTSNASTTAFDTASERVGVCRDFAHLGIALCRALNIPSRYVSGYCLDLDPPDLHAFFQAFIDGTWVNFDATDLQPRRALVNVGIGRDAADCAWCSFFGQGLTKELNVTVTEDVAAI
jgi:transglutaminase-like putative cysteine protease